MIMSMPPDQLAELRHAILHRRGWRTLKVASGPLPEASGSLFERSQAIFDTTQKT